MKYLVLLCDGLADRPIPELGDKTIMQAANIPNIDKLAANGRCGLVHTVPNGMPPGSDVCNLSIFGYDPRKYYTGRSPLEAVSMGINLGENDLALRCNIVTLGDNKSVMESFTAYHIDDKSGQKIIDGLNELFKGENIEFYKGVSYRNLLVLRNVDYKLTTTPPHDITGKKVGGYLTQGSGSDRLNDIMQRASVFMDTFDSGSKGNAIWLWGEGKKPELPSYKEMFGLKGAVISAVDLLKGIGICAGLDVINVPGATGFIDTNFEGKAEYAIKALETHDYVFLHVEAPDESGHMGSIENKIFSIEAIDSRMVPIITKGLEKFKEYRILVTPDHPTPISLMTHSSDPVPAIICGTGIEPDGNKEYNEYVEPSFDIIDGYKIAGYFINKDI